MDREQQLIFDSLDFLVRAKFQELDPESPDFSDLADKAGAIKGRYAQAKALADNVNADEKLREYAKGVCESIAKGLPDMTRAAIDAAAAFRKGDSITGSAAVMDICASAAPILGTMLSFGSLLGAAGGPAGMLAGALFSIIGQILMVFAPKGDSMLDQIEKLLEKLNQEEQLVDIKAVQSSLTVYSSDLLRQSGSLSNMLQKPLKTHEDYLYFDREIVKMKALLEAGNPHNSVTMFTNWRVLEWLKLPEKQDLDRWPEILGVFCKTYTDLVASNLTISLLATSEKMQERLNDVSPAAASPLTSEEKRHLEEELNHLKAYAEVHQNAYAACNRHVLKSLRELLPIARNRGLFFVLANGHVHAGSGKTAIERNQWSTELWNYCRRISITVSKADKDPSNPPLSPRYHFWALEAYHGYREQHIWHGRFDSRKLADTSAGRGAMVVANHTLRDGAQEFSDIWALPAPRGQKGEFVYCSHGNWQQGGDVQTFKLDENNNLSEISWRPPTKSQLMQLRLVTPFRTLQDDPDKDGMPALLLGGSDHYNSILYGVLKNSPDIYVDRANERCYVPSPAGTYSGIAVDSYLLWVFGPAGCACASHASLMSYLAKKRAAPMWLAVPSIKQDLVDLSSCEDKTLFISAASALWTTSYKVDFQGKTIVTEPWTKFAGAPADQVQKLPIPCWNLLQSLNADLSAKVKAAGA